MFLQKLIKLWFFFNIKTLYFNFKYLPFKQAFHFPIYISRGTKLLKTKGKVFFHVEKIAPGMIKLGCFPSGMHNKKFHRVNWEVEGEVHFYGTAEFKYGASIIVSKGAKLSIGDWFKISAASSIVCYKEISVGNNVHISWETIIMDSDFHKIIDKSGERINKASKITIENNVWIGMRATILKGVTIYSDTIVGANAVLVKTIPGTHQILAGNPARIIKKEISWED